MFWTVTPISTSSPTVKLEGDELSLTGQAADHEIGLANGEVAGRGLIVGFIILINFGI